jgi:hypothetical protein
MESSSTRRKLLTRELHSSRLFLNTLCNCGILISLSERVPFLPVLVTPMVSTSFCSANKDTLTFDPVLPLCATAISPH